MQKSHVVLMTLFGSAKRRVSGLVKINFIKFIMNESAMEIAVFYFKSVKQGRACALLAYM